MHSDSRLRRLPVKRIPLGETKYEVTDMQTGRFMKASSFSSVLLAVILVGCVSASKPHCPQTSGWPVAESSLVKPVTRLEARGEFLTRTTEDLSRELARAQEEWFDAEWGKSFHAVKPGDRIWYYAEQKDPVLGERRGYIAFRGCEVIGELTTEEDN